MGCYVLPFITVVHEALIKNVFLRFVENRRRAIALPALVVPPALLR